MSKAGITCLLIILLLASLSIAAPHHATAFRVERPAYRWMHSDSWLFFETDVVALALNEHKPFFVWWYVKDNKTLYMADYKGLIEYYMMPNASLLRLNATSLGLLKKLEEQLGGLMEGLVELAKELGDNLTDVVIEIRMFPAPPDPQQLDELINKTKIVISLLAQLRDEASSLGLENVIKHADELNETLTNMVFLMQYLKENPSDMKKYHELRSEADKAMREYWSLLSSVIQAKHCEGGKLAKEIASYLKELHPPLFLFAGNEWEIEGPGNITDAKGDVIGVWFAYKLVEVRNPNFDFLENNLMIRCRMYFVPVQETTDGLNYTVIKAELKQDVVILKWEWNIDVIRELFSALGLPEPDLDRAGLALWIRLMCVNITDLSGLGDLAEDLSSSGEARDFLLELRDLVKEASEAVEEKGSKLSDLLDEALSKLDKGIEAAKSKLEEGLALLTKLIGDLRDIADAIGQLEGEARAALGTAYSEIEAVFEQAEGLVSSSASKLTSMNTTLAGLMEEEDADVLSQGVQGLLDDLGAFMTGFASNVSSLLDQLAQLCQEEGEHMKRSGKATHVKIGKELVDVRKDLSGKCEKMLRTIARLKALVKLQFLEENTTLAGWFRFVNASIVTCPSGTEIRPVRAAYLEAGRVLHLLLLYGYFGSCSLEHDPSSGLDVPETAEQEPAYTVEAPSGSQLSPEVPGGAAPGPGPTPVVPFTTREMLIIIAAVVVGVAIAVAVVRRRGKQINLY